MAFRKVSDDPQIQAAYEAARRRGETHGIAEIIAFRQPSGTKGTDRAFLAGHHNNNQFENDPVYGDYVRKVAERAGVSIKGKVYKSSLAEYTGDPRAWVSDLSDVRKLCEERGYTCEGAITIKPRKIRPPQQQPSKKRKKKPAAV